MIDHVADQEQHQAPAIASLDDIDRGFASRAFHGTSFSPEERGESRRFQYTEAVNGLYIELWPLAKTNEQKDLLASEMERYRQGYLTRMKAYLASHANVMSPMITGPSNFPVARNQKRMSTTDKRASELMEWANKARSAIKAKLLNARPQEDKDSQEWEQVKRRTLDGLSSGNSLIYSNLASRLERMAYNGEVEMVKRAIELIRDYNASASRPVFTARHKLWTFVEIAEKAIAKHDQALDVEPATIAESNGVQVIANPSLDRVQIVFPGKPEPDMIGKLKREGWNWSPTNKAWQRKLTDAAKYSAKRIAGLTT